MSTDQIARITKAGLDRMERELEQSAPPIPPVPPDTVYAHVERTVHALLDAITDSLPTAIAPDEVGVTPEGIKILAEAVQALSSWPQFNPMNAVDDYRKIAEYEVERAIRKQGVRISGGTTDSERTDVGAAFDAAFSKLTALNDRVAKLEGTF